MTQLTHLNAKTLTWTTTKYAVKHHIKAEKDIKIS
jgi:hypothetical protein